MTDQIARPRTEAEQARHYLDKQLIGRIFNGFVYDDQSRISGMRLGPCGGSPDITLQFMVQIEPTIGVKEVE